MNYQFFGWIATILFGACYIPQIWKTWKTRQVKDLSAIMWWMAFLAYISGLFYGIPLKELPLIVGYSFGALSCAIILLMYYKYRKK